MILADSQLGTAMMVVWRGFFPTTATGTAFARTALLWYTTLAGFIALAVVTTLISVHSLVFGILGWATATVWVVIGLI